MAGKKALVRVQEREHGASAPEANPDLDALERAADSIRPSWHGAPAVPVAPPPAALASAPFVQPAPALALAAPPAEAPVSLPASFEAAPAHFGPDSTQGMSASLLQISNHPTLQIFRRWVLHRPVPTAIAVGALSLLLAFAFWPASETAPAAPPPPAPPQLAVATPPAPAEPEQAPRPAASGDDSVSAAFQNVEAAAPPEPKAEHKEPRGRALHAKRHEAARAAAKPAAAKPAGAKPTAKSGMVKAGPNKAAEPAKTQKARTVVAPNPYR